MTNLKNEFYQFKALIVTEIEQLKNQNKIETFENSLRSFKDLKKELKAFFSINGYSRALGTNSMFKKVFWFLVFSALFSSCMLVVDRNLKGYQSNDVVTQFKVIEDENMIFPAVTFCIFDFNLYSINWTSKNLSSKLINCTFASQPCNESYFEPIQLKNSIQKLDCYSFNSGKNGLLAATEVGSGSGMNILFNLSRTEKLSFIVHENNERPLLAELEHIIEQDNGKIVRVEMRKTIDTKEPFPYSNCTKNIKLETSDLVKEILEQNISYRQIHCFELFYEEYLVKCGSLQNLTIQKPAKPVKEFDYRLYCSKKCPLECTSITFEIVENEINFNIDDDRFLWMNFFYSDRKYIEVLQSVKTTASDLISNTGGVLGLFLELNFFSAYRFILFVFDIIFY